MNSPSEMRNELLAVPMRRWSIRHYLVGLVLACLLPGIIGAGFLFFQEYRAGRERLEKDTIQTARAMARTVDAYLLQAQAVARTLSTDDSLVRGDLRRFHQRAREVLPVAGLGNNFVLTDAAGQQVVNTLREFGEALPRHGNPDVLQRVFANGQPVVSDLYVGGVLRHPVMSIDVPVTRDGKVMYVLSIGILPSQFGAILSSQGLPGSWVTAIFDSTGTIVARTHAADQFVGQKGTEEFIRRIRESGEGAMETVTREGIPTLSIYSRSHITNWSVGIGIPRQELVADLTNTLALIAIGVAGLFVIGFGLARLMGGRISDAVRAISKLAVALGKGENLPRYSSGIGEFDEVAADMGKASGLLRERNASLEQSESYLRQLIATLPGMVWSATPEGAVDFVSQQWFDYCGTAPHLHLEEGLRDAIHPDHRSSVEAVWQRALANRTPFNTAYRLRCHDGSYRWFKSRAAPVLGRNGEVVRWLGVVLDIDDLITAQEALGESEALFKSLTDTLPGLVFVTDHAGRNIFLNAACEAYTGLPSADLLGKGGLQAMHPDDAGQVVHTWKAALQTGSEVEVEYRLRRHDGVYRSFLCRGRPIGDMGTNRIVRWVGVSIDITDRKLVERKFEDLNADLERRVDQRTAELLAANQELEGFTFATSHDLRGPLGRINSFSKLLESRYRDRLEGEGLLFLDFISQNATRLVQLVDDLLNHARIARHDLEKKAVDVPELVHALLQEKAEDLRDAGAQVQVDILPVQIMGDPYALNQALGNLLENALKYSEETRPPVIEIGGEMAGGRYRLWVRDNGIGFDMAYHDKIFEMFQRLHTYNEYQGTGVGLALVKRAVQRMGGRVWAESQPNQGATFFLELAAAP